MSNEGINSFNLICTVILAITSVLNIFLISRQFKFKNENETKKFWFRISIDIENLFVLKSHYIKIITALENEKILKNKLLIYKTEFKEIRDFFSRINFFDIDVKNQIINFLNTCEYECMTNQNLTKMDVDTMLNIILKSLYQYELDNYRSFSIKYK